MHILFPISYTKASDRWWTATICEAFAFFGQCVIHLIGEGKHESQDTILEEMQQSNLVSYIIHKYNTRFPDTVYDLDSLNFFFENMTPYATSQKSGVFKSSNGLLCILSVILAESEYHVHEWKKVFWFQQFYGFRIVLDYPNFDHYLTTIVRRPCKTLKKPIVTTNNRLFRRFGGSCAEPTKSTFQRLSTLQCRSSPTRKARGSNPPGRTKRHLLKKRCRFLFASKYK